MLYRYIITYTYNGDLEIGDKSMAAMSFHGQADVDKVTANIERLASEISGAQS